MTTGGRMKERRKELQVPVDKIADALGVSVATIYRYENGDIEKVPGTVLEPLSRILHTTPSYLMGWSDDPESFRLPENAIPYEPPKYFAPILGSVRAGVGGLAMQEVMGHEPIPEHYANDGESYFWLRVDGDSMSPALAEGDLVLIRAQRSVDNGDVAVVLVDDEEGVVKKVRYGIHWIELISFNPEYPVRRFDNEDVLRISVVGRVVESVRKW